MVRLLSSCAILALATTSVQGFATTGSRKRPLDLRTSAMHPSALNAASVQQTPYFVDVVESESQNPVSPKAVTPKNDTSSNGKPNKKPAAKKQHQEGVLSPVVKLAKQALGETELNKLRAKVISMHSDVIGNFVETYDTPLGNAALKTLFQVADQNKNGKIEKEELATALRALGFSWLERKQIEGIFKRADLDENGVIDYDEFMKEAPKTLRTNLVKLAKKNGGELGLLV